MHQPTGRQQAATMLREAGCGPAEIADLLPAAIPRPTAPAGSLGALLGPLRDGHGWTLRDLAARTRRAHSHLQTVESGALGLSPALRRDLAAAFAVPVGAFDPTLPATVQPLVLTGHPLLLAAVRAFARRIGCTVTYPEDTEVPHG